jgi:hypothetical protein
LGQRQVTLDLTTVAVDAVSFPFWSCVDALVTVGDRHSCCRCCRGLDSKELARQLKNKMHITVTGMETPA